MNENGQACDPNYRPAPVSSSGGGGGGVDVPVEMQENGTYIRNRAGEMAQRLDEDTSEELTRACKHDKAECQELRERSAQGFNDWLDAKGDSKKRNFSKLPECEKTNPQTQRLLKDSDFISSKKQKELIKKEVERATSADSDEKSALQSCLQSLYKLHWSRNTDQTIRDMYAGLNKGQASSSSGGGGSSLSGGR